MKSISTVAKPAEKNSANLKSLLQSPLALRLLLFFVFLPIIEAVFISVLSLDINRTEQFAHREYSTIKALQELSKEIGLTKKLSNTLNQLELKPDDSFLLQDLRMLRVACQSQANSTVKQFKIVGSSLGNTDILEKVFARLDAAEAAIVDAPADKMLGAIENFRNVRTESYPTLKELMDHVRGLAYQLKPTRNILGLEPTTLLYIAGLVNIAFAIALALFVEMQLSRPISRLAKDCEKIKLLEEIDAPVRLDNEISSLRDSFNQMSVRLAEDRNRRSSYLALLQSVQTTALIRVDNSLTKLLDSESWTPEAKRLLERARKNISSLIQLLGSMSEILSQSLSNKITLQCSRYSSKDLCATAVSSVDSLLNKRQLKLQVECQDFEMNVDRALIDRVVLNLLSNAIKYSPDQGEILFSLTCDGRNYCVSVKDSGPGISASEIGKLFKKFSQLKALDGVKRAGTGLGLAICKDIIEAHGGEIACLSEAGKGSMFFFKLPMSATVPAGQTSATPDMNLESSSSVNKNKKPGSIKMQFTAMMLLFICVQFFLFFELFETFKQSALSAKHFAEEKAIVMETQDLFALCLLSIQSAGQGEFEEADDWLKKMQEKIDWLVSRSKAPDQLQFISGSSEQVQFPAGSLLLNAGHSKSTRFFRLLMQADGNLVLDGPKRTRLWETGKPEADPKGNCCAAFQKDGNLVLYHGHSPYWQSASNGYPNSVLVISAHKPYLVIVDAASNIVIWPKGLSVNQELAGIDKQMRIVHKIGTYLDRHPEKSLDTMMRIKGRAESCFNEIEESIYRIFDLQKASFESAYEGDKIFRSRLSVVLAIAAIADLVIILAASFIALRILERINLLKAKTEDFAQGTPINQSLSGNDELTLLDQQLCEASSAILEGETQKQELIAVINHDLRTPLTALLTGIELLADGACGEIAKEPAEILKHSTHELEYLLSQINDLLLIEKIDSGTYNMSTERLCFAEILEESLNKLIDSATKGVSVDIADEFDDAIIRGDRQLLTRLCAIVIANAVSASPNSGKLTVSLREVEDTLKAEIEDKGPGIDPDLQPQIFNRFRFVRGKALTGLGLPLADRLCKLHAGSINLITKQEGTTVLITLPIVK